MKFVKHNDGGHGWLAVKRKLLHDLGIAHKITAFSYQRGRTVYLEEDCDLSTFVEAFRAANMGPLDVRYSYCPDTGRSRVRGYADYRFEANV